LVSGTFTVADARDLLIGLLTYKIEFHALKVFSDRERLGRVDEHSERRIAELKECRQSLRRYLQEADQRGDALRVDSVVEIRVARSPQPRRRRPA